MSQLEGLPDLTQLEGLPDLSQYVQRTNRVAIHNTVLLVVGECTRCSEVIKNMNISAFMNIAVQS